jgi:hypothetical protein
MTGRPVNIADFRCRARKARTAYFSVRDANRSHGLKVVEQANPQGPVEPSEIPSVFDIALAREAQHLRRRAVRPISIQRHAEVIRFGDMLARAVAGIGTPESWPVSTDGPSDLPPAA